MVGFVKKIMNCTTLSFVLNYVPMPGKYRQEVNRKDLPISFVLSHFEFAKFNPQRNRLIRVMIQFKVMQRKSGISGEGYYA